MAAVVGDPVRHSLSPVLHNAAFEALDLDWVYVAMAVPAGGGAGAVAAMHALGIDGLSVTMPLKHEVVGAVDRLTGVAERLQAVNTIGRRGPEVVGDNTDGAGFIDALRHDEGFEPSGRRCLVVGAGGAARAVVVALAGAGAAEVIVVNRTLERAEAAAALADGAARVGVAGDAGEADLIVNATPVGMAGVDDGALPLDPANLGGGQLVVDLVYHPLITPLMEAARTRGAAATNGLGMLIHQAAHAFRIWTAEEPPLEVMSAAALHHLGGARQPPD